MRLVKQIFVKQTDPIYQQLDEICWLSKNLYNATMYVVRQKFFSENSYLFYEQVNKLFKETNQPDYRCLPANVGQQTQKLVDQAWKSYFALCRKKNQGKYDGKINLPNYLDKENGRQVAVYTCHVIQKRWLRQGKLRLTGTDFVIDIGEVLNVQQVRIVPKINGIMVELIYKVKEPPLREDNKKYGSIDLGINNLATFTGNTQAPVIINGKPLKSINAYYNKRKADLQSKIPKNSNRKTTKKIRTITRIRNHKVKDYLHKATRKIVNQAVSNDLCCIYVGYNKGWKQDTNIGKKNNQNFVSIPHLIFVEMLEYKCALVGIKVVRVQESHTSKCSFLDDEPIKHHDNYVGRRIKRGLFRSADGTLINADVNGSLNILRKAVGKFQYDSIKVCGTPTIVNVS